MDLRDASASKNTLYLDIKLHEYLDFCHRNCPKLEILSLRVVGKPWYLSNLRFYVSKIKEQHKKLHSAEQILRAELAEKRQVLKGLRKVETFKFNSFDCKRYGKQVKNMFNNLNNSPRSDKCWKDCERWRHLNLIHLIAKGTANKLKICSTI